MFLAAALSAKRNNPKNAKRERLTIRSALSFLRGFVYIMSFFLRLTVVFPPRLGAVDAGLLQIAGQGVGRIVPKVKAMLHGHLPGTQIRADLLGYILPLFPNGTPATE